jgi:hypothetical protein
MQAGSCRARLTAPDARGYNLVAEGYVQSRPRRRQAAPTGDLFKSDAQPLKVGLTYFPMSTHEPSMLWEV